GRGREWGEVGDGEETGLRTTPFDASRPHPMTEGLPPDCGVWRRRCRESWGNRPLQGALTCVSSLRLDTAGHRRCSGARQVPGADGWPAGETLRGLEPDGWMGRRLHSRP